MNISGIRPYEATGYVENRISNVTSGKVLPQKPREMENFEERSAEENFSLERPTTQTETSYDFAKKYDPDAKYELKGKNSDLASLDIMNNIPKTHRDEALKQYHVFVGSKDAQNNGIQELSGKRQIENFNL